MQSSSSSDDQLFVASTSKLRNKTGNVTYMCQLVDENADN